MTAKNIILTGDLQQHFIIFSTGVKPEHTNSFVDGVIVQGKTFLHYYGQDFSGFYVDFKTGRIGLKALSGKGFYQGKVTEELLISRGYVKKEG